MSGLQPDASASRELASSVRPLGYSSPSFRRPSCKDIDDARRERMCREAEQSRHLSEDRHHNMYWCDWLTSFDALQARPRIASG